MSMEIHVFFRGSLPTKTALSRAMKELGFPFSIKPATGSLEQQSGFMPMMLRGEETGVEFDVYNDSGAFAEFAAKGVDPSLERRASLRWGGDADETTAGLCVAAALAKLVNGAVLDEAEDKLLSVDDAIAVARQNLKALVQPEAEKQGGTRPADIKRYLKPLLKQRSDLALVGRMLIIRPVRHLLRGVFFDRTSDKDHFRVWQYVNPLYTGAEGLGYGNEIRTPADCVWHPQFEPLLFDALEEDIFDHVGRITTVDDLALQVNSGHYYIRMTAFALSGQIERASEVLDEVERSYPHPDWQDWVKSQRRFLDRDTNAICATFHAREAETAKKLKLGDIWEPSPFAVEVPEAERMTRCAEPSFATTPWITRPPGLVQEVPEHPGEIRFADATIWRKGRVVMLVALTRDEAEERHRTRQSYSLATRLPGGNLLIFHHFTHWKPHHVDPRRNPYYEQKRNFSLNVYGSMGHLYSRFAEDFERSGVIEMRGAQIYVHSAPPRSISEPVRSLWAVHNHFADRTKAVYDYRVGPPYDTSRPMTDSDLALCEFADPPFGKFDDFWQRVSTYLENEGFGSFK
jgi:hypothetical protein